jgi:HAD superfamily hydrolase (TIGR01509 family)
MAIEAILFDLGKVLIDFSLDPMFRKCCAFSTKPLEFEHIFRDSRLAYQYETGNMTTAEFHAHLCAAGGLFMSLAEFRAAWSSVFAPELIVSEKLIQSLRKRYPLILVSNTNEAHAEYLCARYPILGYFNHKVFSFEVRSMKPDSRIFEHAITLSGKRPESLFFTDDREENVRRAREMGMEAHQFRSESDLIVALDEAGVEVGDFVHRNALDSRS